LIEGLEKLECFGCPSITTIPMIPGLQFINCSNCPSITTIPMIQGLKFINFSNCPSITSIPMIPGLKNINCSNCPLITTIPMIDLLLCSECKWLNINNPGFDHNIKKLKRLQKWFKDIILAKRLKKITLQLIPLYYHPLAKGGYLHKRNMLYFVESISGPVS